VFYRNFVPKFEIFDFKKGPDLENWVMSLSTSLEMSPRDRAHTTTN